MEYLLGIIATLVGGLFYYKTKAKSAGALLENEQTKKEINANEQSISRHAGNLEAESERRSAIQSDVQKSSGDVSNEELVKFVDSFSKRDK